MLHQEAIERLIRKIGKSSLEARDKDNNMFNVPDVEKEDFENPTVQGKTTPTRGTARMPGSVTPSA